jgi:hypothetical protein
MQVTFDYKQLIKELDYECMCLHPGLQMSLFPKENILTKFLIKILFLQICVPLSSMDRLGYLVRLS